MKKLSLSILILSIYAAFLNSQILSQKIDVSLSKTLSKQLFINNVPIVEVNPPDVNKLLKEDSVIIEYTYRYGKALDIDINFMDGKWTVTDSGKVWNIALRSSGAKSLSLFFDKIQLGQNSELFLTNNNQDFLIGPIREESISTGTLATDVIPGDIVNIVLFEPNTELGKNILHINKLAFGFKDISNYIGYGDSAPCHNDIICPEGNGWQEEADAVAMILIGGERACTGTLLNNSNQNFVPNFLTAFHCVDANYDGVLSIPEKSAVANWVFRFQYESATCGGTDDLYYYSFVGSSLIASWVETDFALLRFHNRPSSATGIRYAGWNRSAIASTSSVGIHHPRGDVMKISVENDAAISVGWLGGPTDTHWRVFFDDGVVEHGSSGSPLFDQNHRVIGQLHGNQNNHCARIDNNPCFCEGGVQKVGEYGRLARSWYGGGTDLTSLHNWLSNDDSEVTANTISIPYVTGPALICSNGTYNLQNPPATYITWSVKPSNCNR